MSHRNPRKMRALTCSLNHSYYINVNQKPRFCFFLKFDFFVVRRENTILYFTSKDIDVVVVTTCQPSCEMSDDDLDVSSTDIDLVYLT